MRNLVLVIALAVACSGGGSRPMPATSGGDQPGGGHSGDTPVASPTGGDTPVASPPAGGDTPVASPTGGDTPTGVGAGEPASPSPPTCDKRIAIKCKQGIDGCTGKRTTHHWCMPSDAKAGPGCEQEIALVCPAGQIDACLHKPQLAKNHICVFN